jgi:hypothetical protein
MVAFLLAIVLGGCTDASRSNATDPCLLHTSEVAAIVHATVGAGAPSSGMVPQPGVALCTYSTDAPFGAVALTVQRPGQLAFREAETGARSNDTLSPAFASLDGLGDSAFSIGDAVHILQRDSYLTVAAQKPTDAFVTVARELAKQVLLHLS